MPVESTGLGKSSSVVVVVYDWNGGEDLAVVGGLTMRWETVGVVFTIAHGGWFCWCHLWLLDATGRRCGGCRQLTVQLNKKEGCLSLMAESIGVVVVHGWNEGEEVHLLLV